MSYREGRTVRLSAVASAGVLGVALLLAGCDTDGTGVEDAGSHSHDDSHVDTALSSSLAQTTPQPTTGASAGSDGSADGTGADAPQPTPPAAAPEAPEDATGGAAATTTTPGDGAAGETGETGEKDAVTVAFGSYAVPLGDATLLCSFEEDPASAGYAWACEAPVHFGWTATEGGEANAVAYRPDGDPKVYALLGNSGVDPQSPLDAGTRTSVGGRYTVDTTAGDAVTVTDTVTGDTVRLAQGGYSEQ